MAKLISATHLARSILRQLLELGVSDFVLSPGSRNAPLSIALFEAAEAGFADLQVRIDERGAAFFALGISKVSQQYVAVICTSGTAAANYHPAVLEARHSNIKLLIITADRPERLRNTGANQTTNQVGLYPDIPSHDICELVDVAKLLTDGPIHLNIQFDEPLLSEDNLNWLAGFTSKSVQPTRLTKQSASFDGNGVIVVGHDRGGFSVSEVTAFSQELGWPLIAEDPISFPQAIAHASVFLADPDIRASLHPESVIVFGRTTLSRSINAYVLGSRKQIVIDPRIQDVDNLRQADQIFFDIPHLDSVITPSKEWISLWHKVSIQANEGLARSFQWSEQEAIRTITSNLESGSALFVGSSRPIRDIEGFAEPRDGLYVYGNRGLAGIDGNTSTALGMASKFERSYALLGDLTFLHDISALVNLPEVNLTIFVIDNNGGGIFSTLAQQGTKGFETIFGTPHNHNIEKIAAGFGLPVERVKNSSDLKRIIAHRANGVLVVVVEVPDRETNATQIKLLYQSVSSAVRMGNNLD